MTCGGSGSGTGPLGNSCAGTHQYHPESLRRVKDHTPSAPEERIITINNATGRQAIASLYDVVTNELTFRFDAAWTLSREHVSVYFRSPSTRTRQRVYDEFFRIYSNHADVLGEMYKALVMDWKNEGLDLRGHSCPIAVRNVYNDVQDHAVSTLLQARRDNRHIFQEYFRIKAKMCRLSRLTRYNIDALATGKPAPLTRR